MVVLVGNLQQAVGLERITPKYLHISMYARTNGSITNEVLEQITFVLTYPTVLALATDTIFHYCINGFINLNTDF